MLCLSFWNIVIYRNRTKRKAVAEKNIEDEKKKHDKVIGFNE